jgi:hypothetical protein
MPLILQALGCLDDVLCQPGFSGAMSFLVLLKTLRSLSVMPRHASPHVGRANTSAGEEIPLFSSVQSLYVAEL